MTELLTPGNLSNGSSQKSGSSRLSWVSYLPLVLGSFEVLSTSKTEVSSRTLVVCRRFCSSKSHSRNHGSSVSLRPSPHFPKFQLARPTCDARRGLTTTSVVTRLAQEPGTPNVFPSIQLILAVLGVDILASIFALFGWISGPATPKQHSGWVDIVTVVKIWGYSFGVTVIILLVCE